jgi:DNA-binding CsgD family transcriptional regulator
MFENPAASAMLDRGVPVYRCRGSVGAREPVQAVSLRLAIDRALFHPAATAHGDAAAPLIALGAPGAASPLLAAVSPAGAQSGCDAVALHLFEAAGPGDRTMAAVARWHGLSPMEAHLVAMLAAGHGVAEIAQQAAVKEDTIRTYLKSVFRKTGTKNQGDLIRLMMSNPVCLETGVRQDQNDRNTSGRGKYVTLR